MITAGIIAEYNPLHNGHLLHLQATRQQASHVVCVMSGNVVQRGDIAIADKRLRAQMALQYGADLVLELPCIWAAAGAQRFSRAGVQILEALGCVDMLSFGSECGDVQLLRRAAEVLEDARCEMFLREQLQTGISYAAARENAVRQLDEQAAAVLASPNDILGVSYLQALHHLQSEIQPFVLKRTGAAHDSAEGEASVRSASYLRQLLHARESVRQFMPSAAWEQLTLALQNGCTPADIRRLERAVLLALRTSTPAYLASLPEVSEGLENRLLAAAQKATGYDELFLLAKTRRYPLARLRRIVLCCLLGITEEMQQKSVPYLRVLGFNERGQALLRRAKKTATLPILQRTADATDLSAAARAVFDLENRASDLFALCTPDILPAGLDRTQANIVLTKPAKERPHDA